MKRNILARRAASAALAACMMFTLSAPALAASTDALLQQSTAAKSAVSVLDMQNDISESATTMDLCNGRIIVSVENGQQYAKQKNIKQPISDLVVTTNNSSTNNTLTIEGGTTGAKVTLSNVNIDAPSAAVSVSGNVELVITGTNTLRSGTDRAGLEKADDNGTLTIDGTGKLYAYGGDCAAGIGSSYNNNVRNIVINGGTITAECTGMLGAGIGGGQAGKAENGKAENIRINGGVVTATGGEWGFGIGSGCYNDTSWLPTTITITGGTVKAIAGKQGAAIGALASANDLTMTGGSLTVQKFNDSRAWIISTTGSEMNRGSLTGAVTYQDGSGNVVVQDYGIAVGRENTTLTRVTSKNYNDILEDGVLCYDIEEKTLKLKDGQFFDGGLTITAPKDVSIDLEANAPNVVHGDLIVNGAKDVKVTKLGDSADAAIEGKAEITCSGDVILENWGGAFDSGRNLIKNGLTVHGANTVTTEGGISGETIIDCTGDIKLGNEWGTTVSKLMVNSANNVTVTSGSWYYLIDQGAVIKCSGTVKISGISKIKGDVTIDAGKDVSLEYEDNDNVINIKAAGNVELNCDSYRNLDKVIFNQANDKPYVYFTDQSSEYKDSRITPIPKTIESSYLRIEPRETYSITVKNGTAQVVGDTDGKLTTAFAGEKVTVSGKNGNPSVTKFGGWKVISPESFELTEGQKNTEENMTFTMPASPVELKASYSFPAPVLDMPVTVKDGTIRVGKGESQTGTVLVQPGQTVTIEANEPVKENESFHHWKVENGTSTAFAPTEGKLGSETEKGTEKIVFTMPQDGVKLTAVYSIPASVLRSTVTVEGGTAESTLGEGSDIPAEIGTTVEITATPYDAEKYPGMEFVEWEIKYPDSFYEKFPDGIPENLQLKLDNAKSATTTFEMPVYPVKLIAHWSASAVAGPDESLDPDFGYDASSAAGGAIAAVAVGGAAIWGGYEITTRVILNDLLPEGAAIPANRGQLALLVWNTAGRPEPAGAPAFADVADPDMAKAAQWCTEQGTMATKGDRFEPEGWTPKFKVIEVWNKAFPKQ